MVRISEWEQDLCRIHVFEKLGVGLRVRQTWAINLG